MSKQLIDLDLIVDNPYQDQGRQVYEDIDLLGVSIATHGLQEMPKARRMRADGCTELKFGHRRLRSFRWLRDNWKINELPDRYQGYTVMPLDVEELTDKQMFEGMVVENEHRKDLRVTEKAKLIQHYMNDHSANSKEAGELFNMNDATVRGLVRLLDLPAEVQQKLDEGVITQGTARTLLSMQKIAPEKVVLETLKTIAKGVDRWGQAETPEEAIESKLNSLDEVVDMWHDNRDGKPRAGMTYGRGGDMWLLDMKNFPNKFLPVLTPVDLAVALGIQDDQQLIAAANTWAMFRRGQLNQSREEIDGLGIPAEIKEKVDHLLNPPACTACPFYTKVGGRHYCGIKVCHTRKTQAWHVNMIQAASKDLGIPIWSEADGKYAVLDGYGDHEKLFKARNKDLRLIEKEKIRGYHYQSWPGVKDDVFMVVMTGKTLQNKTEAVKEAKAVERTQQSASAQQGDMREEMLKQLDWEASLYIKALFDGLNLDAIETLLGSAYGWDYDESDTPEAARPAENATDEVKADFQRRLLAMNMIDAAEDYGDTYQSVSKYATWLIETAKGWGVKLPKSMLKMAEHADEEIAAVSTATKKGKK